MELRVTSYNLLVFEKKGQGQHSKPVDRCGLGPQDEVMFLKYSAVEGRRMIGPLWSIAAPVLAAVFVNIGMYSLNWRGAVTSRSNRYLPPGWVVGSVWVILLGLLGYAHFLAQSQRRHSAAFALLVLIMWCIAYPLLTLWISTAVMDVLSLIVAWAVAVIVHASVGLPCTFYLAPTLAWVSYVAITDSISLSK